MSDAGIFEGEQSSTFIRKHELNDGKILKINQISVGDVGCVVWDAAIVLAKYLERVDVKSKLNCKRILELGSGTGFVGIVAACLGAEVLLTDLPTVVKLMEMNIEENRDLLKERVSAQALVWGETVSEPTPRYDYIVLSDCIYYEQSTGPLVATLRSLCTNDCEVLMSYETRLTANKAQLERVFFTLMDECFTREEVPQGEHDAIYRSDDIRIMRYHKKVS